MAVTHIVYEWYVVRIVGRVKRLDDSLDCLGLGH